MLPLLERLPNTFREVSSLLPVEKEVIRGRAPFISQQAVRSALDALLYTSSHQPPANALESLLLVDEILTNPDLPLSENSRGFATQHLLNTLITDQIDKQRQVFGLSKPGKDETLKAAESEITQDAQSDNPELIGWGLLYYRYVRADLGIELDEFSRLALVDPRTLRRYHTHAIQRLTDRLIAEEWSARERQRRRRLHAAIPGAAPARLIGREALLEQVRSLPQGHNSILVTGPPGIGKSVFVENILWQRIDCEPIDQIVWINEPLSAAHVRQSLSEYLVPEGSSIDCREYMALLHVVVVLDEIQLLLDDIQELENLLVFLSLADVYLMSSVYRPIGGITYHVQLDELDEAATYRLMRQTLLTELSGESDLSDEELAYIWNAVGGNPLLVKLATRGLAFGIHEIGRSLEQVYDQVYTALDENARALWCAFALFPAGRLSLGDLPQRWKAGIDESGIALLRRCYLLQDADRQSHDVQLYTPARQFMLSTHERSPEIQSLIETLLSELDLGMADDAVGALSVAENILRSGWPEIDCTRYGHWVKTLCFAGIAAGHFAQWRAILERHFQQTQDIDYPIQIVYGICLRRLAEWPQARDVFEQIIMRAGQTGAFLDQARALLELSILYRYRGMYERTSLLLNRVEQLISRQPDESLQQMLAIEQAQLAIDQSNGALAQSYLSKVRLQSGRILALDSESALLNRDFGRCHKLAESALRSFERDKVSSARIYTIVGRSYDLQNDLESAYQSFANAVTLLETSDDLFGLERAQLNLGALLLRMESFDDALELLTRAETIQRQLGDRAALAATQHNLRLLRGHITS